MIIDINKLFRDPQLAKTLIYQIQQSTLPNQHYHLMEFCGGHTHTIFKFGLDQILPPQIKMIHGPGCPVCVLPIGRLDMAIDLSRRDNLILCSYGDMMRVPGSNKTSLLLEKAKGADIRMVYSCMDALQIAEENPQKEVVFFAIGFETTTPPTAVLLQQAIEKNIHNFSVFCNHVLTPSAIQNILDSRDVRELGNIPWMDSSDQGMSAQLLGTARLNSLQKNTKSL